MKNNITYKITKIALGLLLLGSTGAYAQHHYPGLNYPLPDVNKEVVRQEPTPNLSELLSDNIRKRGEFANNSNVSEFRKQALFDMGFSVGASSGLASEMKKIKTEINIHSYALDHIFDFRKVLIQDGVIAPVLTEGLSNYAQESDDEVRIADKIYKIEAPAKFVSVYPTWRSYLIFSYQTHEIPPASYLPKDAAEKEIWDQAVKDGWKSGVQQANSIFESSYSRLERDYMGMIKYKLLLAQGLITPTIIGKQNLGVTGGGNEMSINDQLFRISDHSALNPNKDNWGVEYPVTNNNNGVLK